jgi:hypothetical protein
MIGVLAILITTIVSSHRPAGAIIRPRWTRQALLSLGAHMDFATYASVMNESESAARAQHRSGTLPPGVVPIRVGRKWIIPTQPVLELLGLSGGQGIRSAAAGQVPSEAGEQPGETRKPGNGEAAGTPTPAA